MSLLASFNGQTATYRQVTSEYIRLDVNLRVPDEGRFVQIKQCDEIGYPNTGLKYAVPQIVDKKWGLLTTDPNGKVYDYVALEDRWQWFLWSFWDWASQYKLPRGKIESYYKKPNNFRTFAKTTPGSLADVYRDMVEAHRAFTEAGSPEAGSRDVVLGRNLDNKKGYEWLCRPCAGNMLKVKSVVGQYYEVEAIDLLRPCPSMAEVVSNPWLYFWANQAEPYKVGNRYGVSRFPQIKNANAVHGLPAAGTPSPLFSLGGSFRILRSSCREMVNGAEWTPYIP